MAQSDGMKALKLACARVSAGRARNAERDTIENEHGFASPPQCGQREMLRTAVFALHAALGEDDWKCVEEATALIEDAIGFRLSES